MRRARAHAAARRRGLTTGVVVGVLALTGVSCITVAAADQRHAAQPPLTILDAPAAPDRLRSSAPGPLTTSDSTPTPAMTTSTRGRTRTSTTASTTSAASRSTVIPAPTSRPAAPSPDVVGPVLPRSAPLALVIPAIGVRSPLLHLGQTPDGALEVPAPGPHYDDAGWYQYSPTPGSLGPAVIAGHVDSADSGPSVFFRLGSLHPHDAVLVTRADGTVATFTVDDVRRYHKAEFPAGVVYGDTNHAALRLITCGGSFDRASGHYLDNIVVLASLVGPAPMAVTTASAGRR